MPRLDSVERVLEATLRNATSTSPRGTAPSSSGDQRLSHDVHLPVPTQQGHPTGSQTP